MVVDQEVKFLWRGNLLAEAIIRYGWVVGWDLCSGVGGGSSQYSSIVVVCSVVCMGAEFRDKLKS